MNTNNETLVSIKQGIGTITLNRPDKKNALTHNMYAAISELIRQADTDPELRVLVITGAGGEFTAGNDLNDFLNNPDTDSDSATADFLLTLAETTVPIVAAVDGLAIGVGTTLLAHCDFVYADPVARFSLPFINLALVPEAGASQTLVQMAGYHKAAELLMLGEAFDAPSAEAMGLVNKICAPGEALTQAMATAEQLAAKSRTALRHTKALMKRPGEPIGERIYAELKIFSRLLKTEAPREIMGAFVEKRDIDPDKID
ncbi:MAG: enoyl-CoA hydratase [Porticoccaceae bacterium]|nr:enoyl-CoA hydratase [Porticoccaceae bacterium]